MAPTLRKRDEEIAELHKRLKTLRQGRPREVRQLRVTIEKLFGKPAAPLRSVAEVDNRTAMNEPTDTAAAGAQDIARPPQPRPLLQRLPPPSPKPENGEKMRVLTTGSRLRPGPRLDKFRWPTNRASVPEFYVLRDYNRQAPGSDVETTWSSLGESTAKSKPEQQISKIVQAVTMKPPNYTEQEICSRVRPLAPVT